MLEAMKRITPLAIFSCSGDELASLELAHVFDFAYGESYARFQIVVDGARREDHYRKLCLR